MKKIIVILLFAVSLPAYSDYGWLRQNSGTTNKFSGVYMFDQSRAIAVGFNGLMRTTTNGGLTWQLTSTGIGTNFHKVFFLNNNIGLIIGELGVLIRTTDGGSTWNSISMGTSLNLATIRFIKIAGDISNTGFVTGENGLVYKTTNAGANWGLLNTGTSQLLTGISFADMNTGFAAGYNSTLIKTTDGGTSWTPKNTGTSGVTFYGMEFFDASNGIITGGNASYTDGKILITTDGGNSWSVKLNYPSANFTIPHYLNRLNLIVVGNGGTILRSYDGGNNWTLQNNQSSDYTTDFCFSDSLTGLAVGWNGSIVKTTTGGTTGISIEPGNLPDRFSLSQNFPNPFNPETKINFAIKNSGFTTLKVYNLNGREVSELVNENLSIGNYSVSFSGSSLSSGIYFYTLRSGNFTETKKMMFLK